MTWQVVPADIEKWVDDGDSERSSRVMAALLKMKKLDIAELERAYEFGDGAVMILTVAP